MKGSTKENRARRTRARSRRPSREGVARGTSRTLGLLSLGFGASALLAPRSVARVMGVDGALSPAVVQAIGLRELASGTGLLAQPAEPRWRWMRVAGDLMDLSLHAVALVRGGWAKGRLAAATAGLVALLALDAATARRVSGQALPGSRPVRRRPMLRGA